MVARRTTTFQRWLSAHWCLSNSSIGTDSGCCGDCSPVLTAAVTIGTVIPTVSTWLTKHLEESPEHCKGGIDIHKEMVGS